MDNSRLDLSTTADSVEIALLLSEKRFRGAFEFAAHGMALVGLDGRWLKVNKALCEIVGYSQEELLRADFHSVTHPDDLVADLDGLRQLLSGEIPTYQVQKRYRHKQGQIIWVLLSVSPIRDETGDPLYFVSHMQDISAQKRAEAKLAKGHAEMEQRVRDRTAELAGLYKALRRYTQHQQQLKEQERRSVAREIHDEFGGSLTVLKMGLAWLGQNLAGERGQLEERIASLSELTDRCLDVVRKISRDLRSGLLDDIGLVAAIDWQVKEFAKQSAIGCEWHHDQAAEKFPFNHEAGTTLFRICQEALTNVFRHAEATRVTVRLTVDDCVVLTVRDNGKGLTEGQIAGGQTFGLLGMRERLFPHDGTLEISGGQGRGTVIRATMPLERARRDND